MIKNMICRLKKCTVTLNATEAFAEEEFESKFNVTFDESTNYIKNLILSLS